MDVHGSLLGALIVSGGVLNRNLIIYGKQGDRGLRIVGENKI